MPVARLLAAALLLSAAGAHAAPLLRTLDGGPSGAFPSERSLAVDTTALATLRSSETATLDDFPLAADGPVVLELARIRPFGPETRIEEVTATGVVRVPLPDEAYFAGRIRGEPDSRALVIAAADGVRGFVVHRSETYPFGRDPLGRLRVYALRDVDQSAYPPPSEFCGNDLHPDRVLRAPVPRSIPTLPAALPGPNDVLDVDAAIETDNELRSKFASTDAAMNYLTALLAAVNVVYERDVKVRVKFTYVRLWSATDPWNGSDTIDALDEVQAYWLNGANAMNAIAGPRDLVHFISGKPVSGGVAYLDAVCNQQYGFGVSQVYGGFNVSDPDGVWDVLVVTHEMGHNLGSEHTHCYNPPVDQCFNGEPGCYNGVESLPPGGGTIMSYCHLLPGGLSNVSLAFGATVSGRIRSFVVTQPCLALTGPCGDGDLDSGEACDDGNVIAGDGCSAACAVEPTCGNDVVEGIEECDDGNMQNGDGCSAICHLETVCGDGATEGVEQCDDGATVAGDGCSPVCRFEICGNAAIDPNEACDDGNTTSGDGCSDSCTDEPVCGDGELDASEECDDGGTESGDGCTAACIREPCQVSIPHQTAWGPVKMVATPGTFLLRGRFGVTTAAIDLPAVATDGLRLMLDGGSGARALDVTVPGGPYWSVGATRVRYRDPSGAVAGVRTIVLRTRTAGVTTVDLKVQSRGGPAIDPSDVPPTVTVLLGGATAGAAGACGHYTFESTGCVKRGKKLTCH